MAWLAKAASAAALLPEFRNLQHNSLSKPHQILSAARVKMAKVESTARLSETSTTKVPCLTRSLASKLPQLRTSVARTSGDYCAEALLAPC